MNLQISGTDVIQVDPYVYILWKIFGNSLVRVDFQDIHEVLGDHDEAAWRQLSRHCQKFSTVVMGDFVSRPLHVTRFRELASTLSNLFVEFDTLVYSQDKEECLPRDPIGCQLDRTTVVWDTRMNSTTEAKRLREVLAVPNDQKLHFKPRFLSCSQDMHTYGTKFDSKPLHGVEYVVQGFAADLKQGAT